VGGVYVQLRAPGVSRGIHLAREPIVVEDRKREVAPTSLGLRLVHLQHVLEAEQVDGAGAVVDPAVERRQQRCAPFEGPSERFGIHAPRARDALDDRGLARVAHNSGFDGDGDSRGARDPQRPQTSFITDPASFVRRDDGRIRRVNPLGQIPHALPPTATRDCDLAAHRQELEHLGDVAVPGPAGRRPGHHTGVRDVAGEKRPGCAEQVEDVAAKAVVESQPLPRPVVGRPGCHIREIQPQIAHRPDQRVVLEERAVLLQGLLQLGRMVRRSEATPGDQVRAGRDHGCRIDLQERQLVDHRQQVR
jgi:hypothetical protein